MFELGWVDDLDGDRACDAVAAVHRAELENDAKKLYLAAHWADLHNGDALDSSGRVLPGMEQAKRLGGAGTPRVLEFACAEFAALQGMHPAAGRNLLRDALNLRHRHPQLWAAATSGQVRAWQAREVTRLVDTGDLDLTLEAARRIDAATTPYLATLPWGRFLALVEAKVIEADPAAAQARRKAAAADRFVATGRSNEHGLKVLIAKADAGDVIWFLAMVNRVAVILAANGDLSTADVRRSKAVGILATPARPLQLLTDYQTTQAATAPTGTPPPDDAGGLDDKTVVGEGDVHPCDNDADDPDPGPCPTCAGAGTVTGGAAAFTRPARVDPLRLLPPATLYVHPVPGLLHP